MIRSTVSHSKLQGHPNIVDYYGHYMHQGCFHQVLEPLYGKTISQFTSEETMSNVNLEEGLLHVAVQVSGALKFMHNHGIAHTDISPSNIMFEQRNWFLDENLPTVKVIDFGLVVEWDPKDISTRRCGVRHGTPGFMAPEVNQPFLCDPSKIDIYSLGMVLFSMVGKAPLQKLKRKERRLLPFKKETQLSFGKEWKSISAGAKDLIRDCVHGNPEKRPCAAALEHRAKVLMHGAC